MSSSSKTTTTAILSTIVVTAIAAGIAVVHKKKKKEQEQHPVITISLPSWLYEYQKELQKYEYTTDEEMMDIAVTISYKNAIEYKTGGPFGCAIFERRTSSTGEDGERSRTKLLAVGCNRVTALNNSTLHGETVAIQFALQQLNTYSMRNVLLPDTTTTTTNKKYYILVTSCEPCCMCLGSILWSGVHELICGATKNDAESIGFNEGPVYDPQSYNALKEDGIIIKRNILQLQAASVLQQYKNQDSIIY